jgi:hypothetical protein
MCFDVVIFSFESSLAWSLLGLYSGGQDGGHSSSPSRQDTLLAGSSCQAILVVVVGEQAYDWSCRFLTYHQGRQQPLAFIEGLIGECLRPEGLCWLTTLKT